MTPADLELYEERAAVREYMGNQPRPEAEAGAREDVRRWRDEQRTQDSRQGNTQGIAEGNAPQSTQAITRTPSW